MRSSARQIFSPQTPITQTKPTRPPRQKVASVSPSPLGEDRGEEGHCLKLSFVVSVPAKIFPRAIIKSPPPAAIGIVHDNAGQASPCPTISAAAPARVRKAC